MASRAHLKTTFQPQQSLRDCKWHTARYRINTDTLTRLMPFSSTAVITSLNKSRS